MLDFIRRQSTGFLAWIILGGIALVFGLQFGLPSDSLTLGPEGLIEVHGAEVRMENFESQRRMSYRFGLVPRDVARQKQLGVYEMMIDGIVERLLLVHEAEELGLTATAKEAEDMVINGHVMLYGQKSDFLPADEKFNYDYFLKNWIPSVGYNEKNYLEHQSQELIAQSMRDLIAASIVIPEAELRAAYDNNANRLSLRYARYAFNTFADLVDPTPEQLDAYVAENTETLEKRYESQKTRFTELPKQARLLLVQVASTPGEGDEAADPREALTKAREEIAAGTRSFAEVARAMSTHGTAARGGDYGWLDHSGTTDLPEPVRNAVPSLPLNEVSELVETDGALFLLQVTARREGDVPKPEALRELAEESVREEQGKDLAQRAAEEDIAAVIGGATLEEVFAKPGVIGQTTPFAKTSIEDVPVEGEAKPADPADGIARPKAELRQTGPFVKGQRIPRLGDVPQLTDVAWAYEGDAELIDQVFEVPGAFVIAGVEDKKAASDEEYAEQRDMLYRQAQMLKSLKVTGSWIKRRCFESKAQGSIKVNEQRVKALTTYDTKTEDGDKADGEDPERTFTVCDRVGVGGG